MRPPEPDPLRVDVINGWPLSSTLLMSLVNTHTQVLKAFGVDALRCAVHDSGVLMATEANPLLQGAHTSQAVAWSFSVFITG